MTASRRLTVEIWSDVICPFCYIGKRKFESALAQLPQGDRVEVTWRSFQLAPDTVTDPARNAVQNLADKKGWTLDYTRQAIADIGGRALQVGLAFDYDRTVVANTFDAHRLSHYAAAHGRGSEVMERLFKAYFVDGRNVADHTVLTELAGAVGLPADEARSVLSSGRFGAEVRGDIDQAARFGISGVPFFVFDSKFAVSGAQDTTVFLQALQQSLSEQTGDS